MFRPTKKPSQNFAQVMKVLRFGFRVVGLDICEPGYSINRWTFCVIGCIAMYFICTVATVLAKYDENPNFVLDASCTLGTVLQGVANISSFYAYAKRIALLRRELEDLYADYQEKGSVFYTILNRYCKRSLKIIAWAAGINIAIGGGMVVTPAIAYLTTGKRYLILTYEIPGLDAKTLYGFSITMAIHALSMIYGTVGVFAIDMLIIIFLSHAILFADIFEQKVRDLNRSIAGDSKGLQTRSRLEDLIEWHKKYNEFNAMCNSVFYYVVAVKITTAGISMVSSVYTFFFSDYPGVYSYVLYPFLGMYAYCILGTQINICNDRILTELYNIDWFMLPVPEQKLVLMMMMKAQTPSEIQIGGVIPLSVSTGLQITKCIYSIFMMILKCFNR